jgi:hypothetical protein
MASQHMADSQNMANSQYMGDSQNMTNSRDGALPHDKLFVKHWDLTFKDVRLETG